MRTKDEIKQQALFDATVKLVNEIGFVASSVNKIAKEAKVSPATIYVYYKNKDDLLISTYISIKRSLSEAALAGIDENMPIRSALKKIWYNMFDYISEHTEYFQYTEQFANSPYSEQLNPEEIEKHFEPMQRIIQKGIDQKIIKDVHFDILGAFTFYPIMVLANARLSRNLELTEENIKSAFVLAWDAIKY
jgi:AcrR family transcriptional regulator